MMKAIKEYLLSIPRKAWWLIVLATIYVIPATYWFVCDVLSGKLGNDGMLFQYLMQWQIMWLVVSALPLVIRPLGDWVFKRKKSK